MAQPEDYIKQFIDHLGKSLVEDLKLSIPKQLEHIIEQRFKGISGTLEALGRIEEENRLKGKDIENLQISFKKMEIDLERLRENYTGLPKKMEDKVDTAMNKGTEQLLDAMTSQLEVIPTKPAKIIKEKKSLIKRLIRR